MNLDENEILEIAEKVKSGEASLDELKQALGGDKLYEIFEDDQVDYLLKNVSEKGKIHVLLKDKKGFDILEGLLNKKITGDISHFFNIKPEYIMSLPEEEKENMANAIAGDWEDLSKALQAIWKRGIMTISCTTYREDNLPMLRMLVNEENLDYITNIYNQEDIEDDGSSYNMFDLKHKEYFSIALIGEDLYKYVTGEKPLKPSKPKENIFAKAIEENLNFYFDEWIRNGVKFKVIDVEEEYKREKEMLSKLRSRYEDIDRDDDDSER